jgi:acetyl esterase/lipase
MIDSELQGFLDDWARYWAQLAQPATPAQRRAHFERVAERMRQPTPAGVSTDEQHRIALPGSARSVRVRVFRPGASGPRAALIYMHGGAWMQGSPETHWDITARIAAACEMAVISVDYALAPEHPFPAAVDDCRAVVQWAFDRSASLGLRREAIAIGGDSAGGNLAAAMTLAFRDSPAQLRAQLLIYPGVDFSLDRPSHRANADGPIISVASMPAVNAMYCPDPKDLRNPLAAPLLAESHAGLPAAYIAVAEHDPLRDEGIAYSDALRGAGVAVTLDRGPSLIHGYLRAMAYCSAARDSFARMCDWLSTQCET